MTIRKNVLTVLATGSIMLSALTPLVAADTTVAQTGNGSGSTNNVTSNQSNSSNVVQTNSATVSNTVSSTSNTGNNTTNDNTGGNVTVDTGNANSTTDVTTRANANVVDPASCGCTTGATDVTVKGNGSNSQNSVNTESDTNSSVFQTNKGNVTNDITSQNNTGNNDTSGNTGGSVLVLTGNAGSQTSVTTALNANVATDGSTNTNDPNNNSNGNSVKVIGNGSGSNNSVDLQQSNSATLVQNNEADIWNKVKSDLNTGNNTTNDNTGGNVTVDTGNAVSATDVKTLANFNYANMGNCGCTTNNGVNIKEAGNGSYSTNDVSAEIDNTQSVFQTGLAKVKNDIYSNHNTGWNDTSNNTGSVHNDPMNDPTNVVTGYSNAQTQTQTTTNANVFGPNGFQLPGGTNLNFTFDLNGLLSGWGL